MRVPGPRCASVSCLIRRVRQLLHALDEPMVEHVARHFGMKLDAPRSLAEPVRLTRCVVVGEKLGAVRELEAVVVPLEGVEPLGEHADDGVVPARVVDVDDVPADLGRRCLADPAPTARAISCEPRQTPRSGTSRSTASRMKAASSASQGCSASWSGCIAPPKTMIASYRSGASSAETSSCTITTRSSRSPRSSTRSSNSPPPPVEPGFVDDREDPHPASLPACGERLQPLSWVFSWLRTTSSHSVVTAGSA